MSDCCTKRPCCGSVFDQAAESPKKEGLLDPVSSGNVKEITVHQLEEYIAGKFAGLGIGKVGILPDPFALIPVRR